MGSNKLNQLTHKKDVFHHLFGESKLQQENRIRNESLYGNLKSWRLCNAILKYGDDHK